MKNKMMICFAILFFSVISMTILATATVFPSYNNETDCRGCHGSDVSHRHHLLVVNGTHQCTDCHPIQYDNVTQTYSTQVIRNCLVCHPGKNHTNIHHIFASQGLFVCSDCHPIIYDNVSQTYTPYVTWDCPVCHSTVFSIQNVTVTPTPTPTTTPTPPVPLTITNFNPASPVNNFVGDSMNFHVTTDQIADIAWSINGTQVQSNGSSIDASYANTSAALGTWNVSATASNINGNVTYTWIWTVISPPPPPVVPTINIYFPLDSPVNDTVGDPRKFGISTDQIVNIVWYINDNPVQSDNSITEAAYNNTSSSVGTWNVKAVATNANGSVTHSWIWNVTNLPFLPPPIITSYSPNSPVNDIDGASEAFSITINQITDVIWYINGTPVQTNLGETYTNTSASVGTWNVTAVATNANGSATNSWIWNVVTNPKPITTITPPNGQNGWYVTNTIYLNATDSDGIKYTNYSIDGGIWITNQGSSSLKNSDWIRSTRYSISSILNTPIVLSDGIHSIQYYSVDNLGGIESTKTQTVKIDNTHPQITINSPVNGSTYILNQNLIANWFVNDITSGVATATGTYPNGSVINTASGGTKNFSVSATDNAGNTNTKNVIYYIRYNFGNFLQPINNDGSSVFKVGTTIPIKFQLTDVNGNYITNAVARLVMSKVTSTITGTILEPYTTGAGTTGDTFIYSSNGHFYMYNLVTKNMATGTWQIRVNIDDGSSYFVNISLKK